MRDRFTAVFKAITGLACLLAWEPSSTIGAPASERADRAVDLAKPPDPSGAITSSIAIDPSVRHQEIWGFGASASIPVRSLEQLDANVRSHILDLLFSTDGNNAGLSVIRLRIDPGIFPARGKLDWDADAAQVWFVREAAKRSAVQVMAAPWTPPAWMKDNHSEVRGRLKRENYGLFAGYLHDWSEKYRQGYGMNLKWISVQNEPNAKVAWDSCDYTPEELDVFAATVADLFHRNGSPVMVGAPECGNGEATLAYLRQMKQSLPKLDWIPWHNYNVYGGKKPDIFITGYDQPVLMTEVCAGKLPNNPTIADGMQWADQISDHLNANDRGYLFWWMVTADRKLKALIDINREEGTFLANKRLFVFGQFSRFMRPGDIRVRAESSNPQLRVTATRNPQSGLISVVVVNDSSGPVAASIFGIKTRTLSGRITDSEYDSAKIKELTAENGFFTCAFPSNSVTSLREQ